MTRRFSLRRRQALALALSACVLTVAAPTAVAQTTNQDLRSPDAREAAATPLVHSVALTPSVSDAFDWSDAGLGAAAMLALVALTGGTALLVSRGRHRTRTT